MFLRLWFTDEVLEEVLLEEAREDGVQGSVGAREIWRCSLGGESSFGSSFSSFSLLGESGGSGFIFIASIMDCIIDSIVLKHQLQHKR